MQPFNHDTCFLLCGHQSFMFADKACLDSRLVKKIIQILDDEFSEPPGYYRSHHSQVARKKDSLYANKGETARKTSIGTAFSTKCVSFTSNIAFIAK